MSAHPTTMELAVTLSASLTDMMVAAGHFKKEAEAAKAGTSKKADKRPAKKQKVVRNFAATTQAPMLNQPPPLQIRKPYTGTAPLQKAKKVAGKARVRTTYPKHNMITTPGPGPGPDP
ncbi:hypothetical protein E3N88_11646 [Mikania micrantha]|uniref:Uncharacterized protein n=1 Tax=Mikania micrantha TaxID=192012 RepID=A0A5N6PE32_9ASTR|nr:hypothetical protein E3N88_11646 [Mikania micrantha]